VPTWPDEQEHFSSADAAIVLRDVEAGYQPGIPVVRGLSATFKSGHISAIVGANGAGKSTLMKAMAGLISVYSGQVLMDGCDVTGISAAARTKLGLGYVPQTRDVFGAMTVEENLKMGGYVLPVSKAKERVAAVIEILPLLKVLRARRAETLSGGERKMVAIGRALVAEPRVLLVDEPTAGLAPDAGRKVLNEVLPRLSEAKVAVIVVEQRVKDVLAAADWCHVLVAGRVVLSSRAADARDNEMLGAVMLGAATFEGTAGQEHNSNSRLAGPG
jgi:branched-chain amino acid transport system ATP-binding protein